MAAQQLDAGAADFRRLVGTDDERRAQSLFTQGLTPLIGSNATNYANGLIDFASGVGLGARAMPNAWKVTAADEAAGLRMERSVDAQSMISRARATEPQVTQDLVSLAADSDGQLVGLKNAVKTKESLARKLGERSPGDIRDVLRYTMTHSAENIGSGARQVIQALEDAGYQKLAVKNTFENGARYKGINTSFISPDGQAFELQFHTPESYAINKTTHDLYEQMRVLSDGDPEKALLDAKIASVANTIPIPPRIKELVPNLRK